MRQSPTAKNSSPNEKSSTSVSRYERNPCQLYVLVLKNAAKNDRVASSPSLSRMSMPVLKNSLCCKRQSGHVWDHTRALTSSMSTIASTSSRGVPVGSAEAAWRRAAVSSVSSASISSGAAPRVRAIMKPVAGCTMPPVPPKPSTRCGILGSTPPMGMRQYSSSSTSFTTTPRPASRFSRRALSSGKGTAGRATRLVSSTKMRVGENGMVYRNVGSAALRSRMLTSPARWSSRQSMKNMVSSSKGWLSTSIMMPYAPWYPGSNSPSNSTSERACPVPSSTAAPSTSAPSEHFTAERHRSACVTPTARAAWKTTPFATQPLSRRSLRRRRFTRPYLRSSTDASSFSVNCTLARCHSVSMQSSRPIASNSSIHTP
mmetsp:Transcript_1438/g.5723  ORF Transcript_1438/g.5723 Transcript_1438/m.5723 type:complete len:373 (+) Transcript_1438:302-1420(+)